MKTKPRVTKLERKRQVALVTEVFNSYKAQMAGPDPLYAIRMMAAAMATLAFELEMENASNASRSHLTLMKASSFTENCD